MGALLSGPGDTIRVLDRASVSEVREAVRGLAAAGGLERTRAESLVTTASELAQNVVDHARGGEVTVRPINRSGVAGVEVVARDRGPGVADPEAALKGRSRPAGGLGAGLSAAHRLSDELDLDVRWGEGTVVSARKFAAPLPRHEVAVLARVCDGERIIGDDAVASWSADAVTLAVADGLGHGPPAREASARAMNAVRAHVHEDPFAILQAAHAKLNGTRGAVMAVARWDHAQQSLTYACAGNISTHVYRDRTSARLACPPGVLGTPGPRTFSKLNREEMVMAPRSVLVMFTDGLSSRLDLSGDQALLREPPIIIAQRLLQAHGRGHDDALIIVAT